MSDISTTLNSIILDPRDEESIVSQAQLRVFNASNGQLSDFSENSPTAALIQGQAFAASELLYYVNQLPRAIVIDFLKILGVTRNLGSKAVVTLTFNLAAPQGTDFTIPSPFEVTDLTGNFSFFTDTTLVIPQGLSNGTVTATAENTGTDYNLSAYTLTGITQPLTFLSSVTNSESANGGLNTETDEQVITRGLIAFRLKNPTSAADFETYSEEILGEGSVCKAIGLLGANKITKQLGAIHLFLLNANKEPANNAQLLQVRQFFQDKIPLGSTIFASPMELLNINGEIIAKLVSGRVADEVADELWEAFQNYFNPSTYPLEQDIVLNEAEFALRANAGIKEIQTLTLNGSPSNIPLPNAYTLPYPFALVISLSSDSGVNYEFLRGAGEPVDLDI